MFRSICLVTGRKKDSERSRLDTSGRGGAWGDGRASFNNNRWAEGRVFRRNSKRDIRYQAFRRWRWWSHCRGNCNLQEECPVRLWAQCKACPRKDQFRLLRSPAATHPLEPNSRPATAEVKLRTLLGGPKLVFWSSNDWTTALKPARQYSGLLYRFGVHARSRITLEYSVL